MYCYQNSLTVRIVIKWLFL